MKQIVAVLCLISMQMVKSETSLNISEICTNETGVTQEAFIKGKEVLSRDYFCYRACTLKKLNLMTSENKMDVENIKKAYGSGPIPVLVQKLIRYAEMCNRIVIHDPDMCIAFNQTFNCIRQASKMNESVSIKQICMHETGTTEEQLMAYRKPGAILSRGNLCLIACYFKHHDYWQSGNQFNVEKIAQRLKTDVLNYTTLIQVGKECNGQAKPDDDTCIAFNQTWNCIVLKTNESRPLIGIKI